MNGAVAILILMFKEEILKMATSKHTKKMYLGHETGQNSSDFKKTVDIPVGGDPPVTIFATRTPQTPKKRLKTTFYFPDFQTCKQQIF